METQALAEAATAAANISILDLVWTADMVIKLVVLGLVAASVWTWAIIIEKVGTLRQIKHLTKSFEEKFWSGGSLDRLYDAIGTQPRDPMSAMFVSAMKEWKRTNILKSKTDRGLRGVSLRQRIENAMQLSMDKEVSALDTRMGFLASTGAVAPFVGLFGTVWGIMNSFAAMGVSHNNSLSTIAPGIAEALFTTALGLIAAIPAVVAYNKISSDIDRYAGKLENFMTEFGTIMSREIDDTSVKADMAAGE